MILAGDDLRQKISHLHTDTQSMTPINHIIHAPHFQSSAPQSHLDRLEQVAATHAFLRPEKDRGSTQYLERPHACSINQPPQKSQHHAPTRDRTLQSNTDELTQSTKDLTRCGHAMGAQPEIAKHMGVREKTSTRCPPTTKTELASTLHTI